MKKRIILLPAALMALLSCSDIGFERNNPWDPDGKNYNQGSYTLTIAATPGGSVDPSIGKHPYNEERSVTVTASAHNGYTFTRWSGASTSTSATIYVTMDANKTLTANFQQRSVTPTTYTLTIAATSGGSVSPSVGAHTYDAGTSVTVMATAETGYTFTGWSDASSSTDTSVTIMMDGHKTLTANFQQDVTLPPTITTFVDNRDGTTYRKVTIGTQTWMAENLNYDVLETASDVCYDNNTDNCAKYGRLYNWSTAMAGGSSSSTNPSGVLGVCPAGWHLPSDAEWTVLTDYVGGAWTAGPKLKSTSGWISAGNETDQYGFSALPGGYGYSNGSFGNAGTSGYWWSVSERTANYAWIRSMNYSNELVYRDSYYTTNLYSVRCVADAGIQTPTKYTLTIAATSGGTVSPSVGAHRYDAGTSVTVTATANSGFTFNNWSGASESTSATVDITMDGHKTLTANFQPTTYTVTFDLNGGNGPVSSQSAQAGNSITLPGRDGLIKIGYTFDGWNTNTSGTGTNYSAGSTYTPDNSITLYAKWNTYSGEGGKGNNINNYKTVSIGTQTWMAENLDYDVDGSMCYDNDPANCEKYGRLYNWATAMGGASSSSRNPSGVQGVCPAGWHLPSQAEWTVLEDAVGGSSMAGRKLKSQNDWDDCGPVGSGNSYVCEDAYGWSALPGGGGDVRYGIFYGGAGSEGYWWSATDATECDANFGWGWGCGAGFAWGQSWPTSTSTWTGYDGKESLFSVRCVANQ